MARGVIYCKCKRQTNNRVLHLWTYKSLNEGPTAGGDAVEHKGSGVIEQK